MWTDTQTGAFTEDKIYVVQTNAKIVQRCILMTTDPGDLVLDPTCGSGTTAYVAEQWGRRWITIDTSRVALALARARVMGARYPYYLLADSPEGQRKEAEITRKAPSQAPTYGNVRHGFVYERVPHITLKSIANNAEIDVIHERMQPAVEAALAELNETLTGHPEPFPVTTGGRAGQSIDFTAAGEVTMPSGEPAPANGFLEWEVPRDPGTPWPREQQRLHTAARAHGDPATAAARRRAERALTDLNTLWGEAWTFETLPEKPFVPWPSPAEDALHRFREARIARQREIDASIAAKADHEYLYDKPCEARDRVRVAGPFTVESLSPHRVLTVDENDELVDGVAEARARYGRGQDFADIILENLRTAGVQQAHKTDRIAFTSLTPWPGRLIYAEGRYLEGADDDPTSGTEKRAGVFIGPEFGTVSRPDLVASTREAADTGFDVLIACAFNYDAHSSEFDRLGRLPVLKARMNADLHMADDLKNTGKGNLFVIFGEPDVEVVSGEWLVTGNGRMVANYDGVKELSGLGSLEEINRLGGTDLPRFKQLSAAIAAIQALSPTDFPLSLSTNHYTQVTIHGLDVFHPQTGEIRSDEPDGIACWFIDTDYDEESFFVRHAYFLGANDPYKALRTTLRAEIDPDAWASLHSDTSQPFPRPKSGRIAVKVINHLGDEVMKVFRA